MKETDCVNLEFLITCLHNPAIVHFSNTSAAMSTTCVPLHPTVCASASDRGQYVSWIAITQQMTILLLSRVPLNVDWFNLTALSTLTLTERQR